MNLTLPLLVIGGGGHAKVLIDTLLIQSQSILGFTDIDPGCPQIQTAYCLGGDEVISEYPTDTVKLVNGLGSVGNTEKRRTVFEKFREMGYSFACVIHPASVIAGDVSLSEGVQVMAGAIIQAGSSIGENVIINTKASVDHDCIIGDHVHLAPGVTLSGGVQVEDGVHIGTGATVIQGIRIGRNSIIGAGTLVLKDVQAGTKVLGITGK